jgi:hypothetical protein
MAWMEKWFPRTGNSIIEGMRLATLNLILLIGGGFSVFLLFWLVNLIRSIGIPLPFPVWLVVLLLIVPYYVLLFQYGKAFGDISRQRRLFRGFMVGAFGQLPNIILLAVIARGEFYRHIDPQIWRIMFTMMTMIAVVAPIMVGLGSIDSK